MGCIRDFTQMGMDYISPGETFVFADWFIGRIANKELGGSKRTVYYS